MEKRLSRSVTLPYDSLRCPVFSGIYCSLICTPKIKVSAKSGTNPYRGCATSLSNVPNLVEDRVFPLGRTELLPLWSEWVFLSQGDVASGVFLMRLVLALVGVDSLASPILRI